MFAGDNFSRKLGAVHLIEFKYSESLNIEVVQQIIGYDHFYRKSQGLKKREADSYVMVSKTPKERTLRVLGYEKTDQAGVYRSQNVLLRQVTLLVLNELGNEVYNACYKAFGSKRKVKEAAAEYGTTT